MDCSIDSDGERSEVDNPDVIRVDRNLDALFDWPSIFIKIGNESAGGQNPCGTIKGCFKTQFSD